MQLLSFFLKKGHKMYCPCSLLPQRNNKTRKCFSFHPRKLRLTARQTPSSGPLYQQPSNLVQGYEAVALGFHRDWVITIVLSLGLPLQGVLCCLYHSWIHESAAGLLAPARCGFRLRGWLGVRLSLAKYNFAVKGRDIAASRLSR